MMLAARSGGLANAASGVLLHGLHLEETCQEPWLVEKRKGGRGTTGKRMDRSFTPRFCAPTLLRLVVESHGWLRGGRDVEMGAASLVPSLTIFSPKVAAAGAGGKELLTLTSHDPASGEKKCSVISYPW